MTTLEEMGPLPKIHRREETVRKAQRALEKAILDWDEEHKDLTTAEHISVVQSAFYSHMSHLMRHLIRIERHGDPDKPGGLE